MSIWKRSFPYSVFQCNFNAVVGRINVFNTNVVPRFDSHLWVYNTIHQQVKTAMEFMQQVTIHECTVSKQCWIKNNDGVQKCRSPLSQQCEETVGDYRNVGLNIVIVSIF